MFSQLFSTVFLKWHSLFPEKFSVEMYFGKFMFVSSFSEFERKNFEPLTKFSGQICQNCTLRVQKHILSKNNCFENLHLLIVFHFEAILVGFSVKRNASLSKPHFEYFFPRKKLYLSIIFVL